MTAPREQIEFSTVALVLGGTLTAAAAVLHIVKTVRELFYKAPPAQIHPTTEEMTEAVEAVRREAAEALAKTEAKLMGQLSLEVARREKLESRVQELHEYTHDTSHTLRNAMQTQANEVALVRQRMADAMATITAALDKIHNRFDKHDSATQDLQRQFHRLLGRLERGGRKGKDPSDAS